MITPLHDLANRFVENVTVERIFPDSRNASPCLKGTTGVVLYDSKNKRFTLRRFDGSKQYTNFDPNVKRELTTAARLCGLTFRTIEQDYFKQVNRATFEPITPDYQY